MNAELHCVASQLQSPDPAAREAIEYLGVERRMRFLAPMTAVILANHRRVAPFGLHGGQAGAVGRNWVERANGSREEFGGTEEVALQVDDVFVIETPGAGGYGLVSG